MSMNGTRGLTLSLFAILLLLGLGQQMNGQTKEPRRFFPVNDNTAFIDREGRVVITAKEPGLFAEVLRVSSQMGGFRGPDEGQNWITFGEFSEGLAEVGWSLCPRCRNPFWINGFIDETGKLVIPPRGYNSRYGSFHEGLAQYSGNGWGFVDRTGRIVIPAKFYEASDFSEGLALVRLSEQRKSGYINQEGATVIPFQFEWASDFHEGLAAVALSRGKYGFINKAGKVVLHSPKWLEISDFSEGLAGVKVEVIDNSVYRGYKDERYGFIDQTGRFVIPPGFDRVQKFSEGRSVYFQPGKNHGYGFIDAKGQVVIKPEFVDAKSFAEGLAAAAINSDNSPNPKKLWGYINCDGAWLIQPQFKHVNSFNGGLAAVDCDEYGRGCRAYIDTAGKVLWQKNDPSDDLHAFEVRKPNR